MTLHQILERASPGDAITNMALTLRQSLRQVGRSEIYAPQIHPQLSADVRPLTDAVEESSRDLLLYHTSAGTPEVTAWVQQRSERLVLVYHDSVPRESLAVFEPKIAHRLARGRSALEGLRDRVTLAFAVSRHDAVALQAMGYPDVRVLPVPFNPDHVRSMPADEKMARRLATEVEGPLIVFAGHLLPHERPDFLLTAYHILSTYLMPDAQLALIGAPCSPTYRRALETFIGDLGLSAWITGWLDHSEVIAFYKRAGLFVTMSEHQGACLPVLEAMVFGVPVMARAFGGVAETIAGAGLLLRRDASPTFVAEAMYEVLSNVVVSSRLTALGQNRMRAFEPDAARGALLRQLAEVI